MSYRAALLAVALLAPAQTAAADTIYLTNGRVIRSESVRVVGDLVIFRQFGGEVTIPAASVLRIVEDDEREETTAAAEVAATGSPTGDAPAVTASAASASNDPATVPTDSATGGAPAVPGNNRSHESYQPEYWIERIRDTDERIERVQAELDRLPLYDEVDKRLLRFSGQALYFMRERERWDKVMRGLQQTRKQLTAGARRAGITPGALREGLR